MPAPPSVSIASANGLSATRRAHELLVVGADALDAAVAGVTLAEDDPEELTVGYGGLPNEDGIVELDAAVMHGPTHRGGAVAGLRNVRHAAQLAQRVMEQTNHTLLVGEGALQFARAHGFPEENLLTDTARKIWLYWRQTRSEKDDWLPPPADKLDPAVVKFFQLADDHGPARSVTALPRSEADREPLPRPTGTIHCSCLDQRGDISCTTTTSGLAFKIAGRVGDSAILGAGLYVDNTTGSCGSTGRGEANLRELSAFAAVDLMRRGASPVDAGLEVLQRIADRTPEPHLLDASGRPNFGLKLYLLHRDGRHVGVSLWGPSSYAVTDADGTRLEPCRYLFERA